MGQIGHRIAAMSTFNIASRYMSKTVFCSRIQTSKQDKESGGNGWLDMK
jgi:hypothetical protein